MAGQTSLNVFLFCPFEGQDKCLHEHEEKHCWMMIIYAGVVGAEDSHDHDASYQRCFCSTETAKVIASAEGAPWQEAKDSEL